MRSRILTMVALVVGLVVCQISFLPTWPAPVSHINLIVCLLVFLTIHWGYGPALALAFSSGLILEVYTPYPFGTVIVSLLLVVGSVYLLATRIFTNRSWSSLVAMSAVATLVWWIGVALGNGLLGRHAVAGVHVSLLSWNVLGLILWQLILHSLISSLLFYILYTFSRSARSGFHLIGNFR